MASASFVQIHTHTEYSPMDGLSTCDEAVAQAVAHDSPALAITDHGGCFGHPQFQKVCLAAGINPIFGIETYFQPDRLVRPPDTTAQRARLAALNKGDGALITDEVRRLNAEVQAGKDAQALLQRGSHLILLAQGDKGLHDMWAASTEAYATGFYHKPRMDWELLERYGTDLIATTSCLGGIIARDIAAGRYEQAWKTLDRLRATFPGRLYLEIQANELPEQILLNRMLAEASRAFGIPLVAACDAHYPGEEDEVLHRIWMRCAAGKGKDDYWHFSPMLTEDRVRETLLGHGLDAAQVEAAIRNTGEIAERCTARIGGHYDPPVFTRNGRPSDDARHLRDLCEANWHKVPDTREYRDRMEFEFDVVAGKGLAGSYLIVENLVTWARSQNYVVGPGRGSDAGSLMSYLVGITSTDPIPARLLFERFLTPGRAALPDFDLDFASSARTAIQGYAIRTYGEGNVVRVGTHMRYGAKGILNKLFSALSDTLPAEAQGDAVQISSLIEEAEAGTAGLGLPWEEITEDRAIQEYMARYGTVFRLAAALHGRLYSYGKHPAGLIISPGKPLMGTMPMRLTETGNAGLMVSQWDYRIAEDQGLLKLDLLTLRTLDTIQKACELIAKRTGQMPDPRTWDAEHSDPQVYDMICTGQTLGVFQIETPLCTSYAERMRPRTLDDLADLTTYIRPGPRNSGAAESYLRRRDGAEEIDYPHPLLEEHLQWSYGVMLYQEDILRAVRVLAGYDDLEADGVRKILGKKLTDKIAGAGKEFVACCVERGHDREQIEALWEKIREFGKYAFNRAHGYSYGVLSYWTAWLKTHYPLEFLTAVLSTLDKKDRMAAFAVEARRLGIQVLPPDVRFCGGEFTFEGLSIRYGLSSVNGVGAQALDQIVPKQPYTSLPDFRQRAGVNVGVLYALARAGALDALVPSRRGLLQTIEAAKDGSAVRCVHKAAPGTGPGGLPCGYDWGSEPQPLPRFSEKTGKQLKVYVKQPPKRCTVACRRYTPPASLDLSQVPEHSPAELFRMDAETYGCWMHPAPFEQIEQLGEGMREQARQMALMVLGAPVGTYPLAAIYGGSRTALTRTGSRMWWVTLVTEVSSLSLACFSPWRDDEPDVPAVLPSLRIGTLVAAEVIKRSYVAPGRGVRMGWNLAGIRAVK